MNTTITIDINEYNRYFTTIDNLRKEVERLNKIIIQYQKDIAFLKDSGENVLIIERKANSVYEYKAKEREILSEMVSENQKVRMKNDELNINLQEALLKIQELNTKISGVVAKYDHLKKRSLWDRIMNKGS